MTDPKRIMVHYTSQRVEDINEMFNRPWRSALINAAWFIRSVGELMLVVFVLIHEGLLDDNKYFYYNAPAIYAITNIVVNSSLSLIMWATSTTTDRPLVESFFSLIYSGTDQLAIAEHYSIAREMGTWPLIKGTIYTLSCIMNVVTLYPPFISKYVTTKFVFTAWLTSISIVAFRGLFTVLFGRFYLKKHVAFSTAWIIEFGSDDTTDIPILTATVSPDGNPQEGPLPEPNRTFISYVV